MTEPGDERVIALLKDAVPPPPDTPARVDAVRVRAGRQRYVRWSQVIGAAASVLLVVGVSAAVAQGGRVRKIEDALPAATNAMRQQTSVAFAGSVRLAGTGSTGVNPFGGTGQGLGAGGFTSVFEGSVAGRISRAGDGELTAQMPGFFGFGGRRSSEPMHVLLVDNQVYRGVAPHEHAPKTVKWIREENDGMTAEALLAKLPLLAAFAGEARYAGDGSVRGVTTARYDVDVTVPFMHGKPLVVRLELDERNLPRRLSADVPLSALFGSSGLTGNGARLHAELDLYDYGKPVDVSAPPAAEVMDAQALLDAEERRDEASSTVFDACISAYDHPTQAQFERCLSEYEAASGQKCEGTTQDGGFSYQCDGGGSGYSDEAFGTGTSVISGQVSGIGGTGGTGSGWTEYPPSSTESPAP